MNFIENLKLTYKNGNMVIKLIFVNVAVFLIVSIISVIFRLFNLSIKFVELEFAWAFVQGKEGGI